MINALVPSLHPTSSETLSTTCVNYRIKLCSFTFQCKKNQNFKDSTSSPPQKKKQTAKLKAPKSSMEPIIHPPPPPNMDWSTGQSVTQTSRSPHVEALTWPLLPAWEQPAVEATHLGKVPLGSHRKQKNFKNPWGFFFLKNVIFSSWGWKSWKK